jgi:ribosome-binding factor A
MIASGHRAERLASQIQIEVEEMLAGELADPRIGLATVTRVEVSPDYRHARVWVSTREEGSAGEDTLAGLTSAAGYIRHEISQRLRMRRAPEITFHLDCGDRDAGRLEALLQDLRQGKG